MAKATVIYGPPGTGKSHRIMNMVKSVVEEGCDPKQVCLLSFTKAAAKELSSRNGISGIHISTIHSLAYQVLGVSKEQVVSNTDLNDFSRRTGFRFNHRNVECAAVIAEGDLYLACYNKAKSRMVDPHEAYDKSIAHYKCNYHRYSRFVNLYDEYKRNNGLLDFSDMIHNALEHDGPNFKHIFIDEAQDLSLAQWTLIDHWMPAWDNIYIAGDDDQCIYAWSGAHPSGMQDFQDKYNAEKIVLSQSYRVPEAIYDKAQDIILRVHDRVRKDYFPAGGDGGSVRTNMPLGAALAQVKHGDDTLILYRNHTMRDVIQKSLHMRFVPYEIEGYPSPKDSPTWRCAVLWNMVQERGWDALSASAHRMLTENVKTALTDGVKNKIEVPDVRWFDALKFDLHFTEYVRGIDSRYGLDVEPTVKLSTIHGSKGREADKVIVLNAITERTFMAYGVDRDPEIRTFYVAVTRARKELIICNPSNSKYRRLGFM